MTKTIEAATCSDWELICAVNLYENDLPQTIQDVLMTATWKKQDGYGKVGFRPPQGWDWSGIRDSSEPAKKNMAQAIRDILARTPIKSIAYETLQ